MTDAAVIDRTSQPYEELLRSSSAASVMSRGWILGKYAPVPVRAPIDWRFKDEASRSHNYHLHALDLIDPLLAADSAGERDKGYLEAALEVALDWAAQHIDRDRSQVSPMAWYDMAVGLRAYRLAYVFDEARRRGLASEEELNLLEDTVQMHREALIGEESFAAHSNHGLYQACGQLAMARRLSDLPGMDEAADQARRRLAVAIASQFSSEGVHKEHSPGYHLRVLESLAGAEAAGLFDTPELQAVLRRARASLAWFVKPDGRLVNFGDTDESKVNPAFTGGEEPSGVSVFKESGYVVFRHGGSYFAQALAYHSRTHKQADDLTFVWSENGRDIVVDAGRYGYRGRTAKGTELWSRGFWYDDPSRVFVESTHAHNTVEIDGQSYDRRTEKPYGSALVAGGRTAEGRVFSLGEVDHGPLGRHRRLLILAPGEWLLVVDRMQPPAETAPVKKGLFGLGGGGGTRRRYDQWFHLAPDYEANPLGSASYYADDAASGARLFVASLMKGVVGSDVYKGASKPRLQGWTSPRDGVLLPAPAFAMETSATGPAMFATLLALSREEPQTRPAVVKDEGDRLDLAWDGVHISVDGFLGQSPAIAG